MAKFDLKLWGIRVRKVLVVALIAPIFTVVSAVVAPQVSQAVPISAGDGSCTQEVGSISGISVVRQGNDCVITFTSTTETTWQVPARVFNLRYLVVAGGASGDRGVCGVHYGHGGGGGQALDSILQVTPSAQLRVQVGGGGAASGGCYFPDAAVIKGNPGGNSIFGDITANGGRISENTNTLGGTSGAGFAGSSLLTDGTQGTYPAGAGGGAAGPANVFDGGPGLLSNITGSTIMY